MAALPRFVTLLSLDGHGRFLELASFAGHLTFTSNAITHLTVHEVIPNLDKLDGTIAIRSANGRFWRRRDDRYILADRETFPQAGNKECYFKATALPNGVTVFQSVLDGRYLKRYTHFAYIVHGCSAATAAIDAHSRMLVTAVDSMVVALPRRMALLARDGSNKFLSLDTDAGVLAFTSSTVTRLTTHEVVDTTDDGAVTIRSSNGRFWRRRDDGYIVADRETIPQASDKECYYKPFWFGNLTIFQSILDGNYLKRYTTTAITGGYNAAIAKVDIHCQMLVTAVDR